MGGLYLGPLPGFWKSGKNMEWILILLKNYLDRIYRISWIFLSRLSRRKPGTPIAFGE
jgi:hypothetical protein